MTAQKQRRNVKKVLMQFFKEENDTARHWNSLRVPEVDSVDVKADGRPGYRQFCEF